jgi:hypothetical protein
LPAVDGVTDQDVEVVPYSGHRRMQPCRYDEGPTGLNAGRRWPLRGPNRLAPYRDLATSQWTVVVDRPGRSPGVAPQLPGR